MCVRARARVCVCVRARELHMNRGNGVINGDLARRDAEACVNGGMRLVEAPSVAFVTRIRAAWLAE